MLKVFSLLCGYGTFRLFFCLGWVGCGWSSIVAGLLLWHIGIHLEWPRLCTFPSFAEDTRCSMISHALWTYECCLVHLSTLPPHGCHRNRSSNRALAVSGQTLPLRCAPDRPVPTGPETAVPIDLGRSAQLFNGTPMKRHNPCRVPTKKSILFLRVWRSGPALAFRSRRVFAAESFNQTYWGHLPSWHCLLNDAGHKQITQMQMWKSVRKEHNLGIGETFAKLTFVAKSHSIQSPVVHLPWQVLRVDYVGHGVCSYFAAKPRCFAVFPARIAQGEELTAMVAGT